MRPTATSSDNKRNTTPSSPRRRRSASAISVVVVLAVLALSSVACSDATGDDVRASATTTTEAPPSTSVVVERPDGPTADLSEEISGGSGPFVGAASSTDLAALGYEEVELVASGTASSYRSEAPLAEDGRWSFAESSTAEYRTRVLVRRPLAPDEASGTVIVEWLNVSGGIDANPEWAGLEDEIVRQGHTWVGVSAQRIGVEGGPVLVPAPGADGVAGKGLRNIAPERYGSLSHPGDGFSFDIFTQVARAVRSGTATGGGDAPTHVLAAGESQSAIALVTYYNGIQPLTSAFDGFFVHSRASVALPLVGPGEYADLAGAIGRSRALFRTDLHAPVLDVQAESDVDGVLTSVAARQPDSDRFRLWEVAGTAHADRHLLGPIADATGCGVAINDGPLHLVARSALRALDQWVRTGDAPPTADRLEVTDGAAPKVRRDEDGIALGGVRTPPVDVPVDVLSGVAGPGGGLLCQLLGSTVPLGADRLAARYPSRADYEDRYQVATDAAIAAGFLLDDDRTAVAELADPARLAD